MSKRADAGEDAEDEEFEGYEPEYHPEEDEAGELWCPKCGAEMYADADRCPSCGDTVTPGARRSPLWVRTAAILLIVLIVAGLLASLFHR